MYAWLKDTYARDDARAVRLDVAAGVGAEQVLRRKSGVSLSEPVPALYGRAVFKELTSRDLPGLVKHFSDERWVWGDSGLNTGDAAKLATDVTGIYEQDYITAWDAILNDLELVPFSSVQQTADGLAILSGPTSPLRSLLQTVSDNTSFVEAPESPDASKTVAGTVSSARKSMTDRLGKMFPGQLPGILSAAPGARITAHFQPIHRLLAGAPGATPLDAILTRLAQLQEQLRALGPDVGGGDPLVILSSPALRDTFRLLQQEAEALPPSIRPLVTQIGAKSERSLVNTAADDLTARYQTQVLRSCTDFVAGRYPFTPGSLRDVPMTDFGRIFGYGRRVRHIFLCEPRAARRQDQHPVERGVLGFESMPAILDQFEAASRVREAFFATGSQRPDLRFSVTITDRDALATRFMLDVDGQRFEHLQRWPIRRTRRLARTEARIRSRPLRGPFGYSSGIER